MCKYRGDLEWLNELERQQEIEDEYIRICAENDCPNPYPGPDEIELWLEDNYPRNERRIQC